MVPTAFLFKIRDKKQGEFLEKRLGGRILFGQQMRKLGQLSIELRFEHISDKPYTGAISVNQDSELRTIAVRSIADNRDQISFTKKGIYNVWMWESGDEKILTGQFSYIKTWVNLEGYYTNWPGNTIHVRLFGGIARG